MSTLEQSPIDSADAVKTDDAKSLGEKSVSALNKQDEISDESEASENLKAKASEDQEEQNDDESEGSNKEEKNSKHKGVQKKISKLVRKVSEREQELEYWKKEALKSQNQKPDEKKLESTSKGLPDGKPDPDKFQSHEEYDDALLDWKLEQREKKREAKTKEEQVKTEFQKKAAAFQAKIDVFKKDNPDFDDLLEEVDDVPGNVGISESILASENGPALMKALAQDKALYQKIAALEPIVAAVEIGKLEAKLFGKAQDNSSQENSEKKQTKAPPPLTPVSSKGAGSIKKSIYEAGSYSEYERLRREQMKSRRA